jgi:hypothetical protein
MNTHRVEVYEFEKVEDAMAFFIAAKKAHSVIVSFNGVVYAK